VEQFFSLAPEAVLINQFLMVDKSKMLIIHLYFLSFFCHHLRIHGLSFFTIHLSFFFEAIGREDPYLFFLLLRYKQKNKEYKKAFKAKNKNTKELLKSTLTPRF